MLHSMAPIADSNEVDHVVIEWVPVDVVNLKRPDSEPHTGQQYSSLSYSFQ